MDRVLKEMVSIYKPDGIDWMHYSLSKKNPYTYHHIREVRNGGRRIICNGAIITLNAHSFLNYLDREQHRTYTYLNGLFLELNRTLAPPTEDYFEEVDFVLKKVRNKR